MPNDTAPAQWDGRPENPDVDGWHWLKDDVREHPTPVVWNAELGGWVSGPLYSPQAVLDLGFQYLGPCLTPSEHHQRTQAASAAAWLAARDACAATIDKSLTVYEMCRFIRALPPPADARAALAEVVRKAKEDERERMAGEVRCEAEQERDHFFNMLGRITSELDLPMDVTAGRIIEAIRDLVDAEREACASVSVTVTVPEGAEGWTPLEAWEEALIASDEAFRAAIRARSTEDGA